PDLGMRAPQGRLGQPREVVRRPIARRSGGMRRLRRGEKVQEAAEAHALRRAEVERDLVIVLRAPLRAQYRPQVGEREQKTERGEPDGAQPAPQAWRRESARRHDRVGGLRARTARLSM